MYRDYRECDAWNTRSAEFLVIFLLTVVVLWAIASCYDYVCDKFEKRRVKRAYNDNLLRQRIRKEILHEQSSKLGESLI